MTKRGRTHRYVYCYDAVDLRTGKVATEAYVGKTSSHPSYRDRQHRAHQVWAGHIVGDIRVLWIGYCGRLTLWAVEIFFIVVKQPLFNVQWNRRNPHRITPWQARNLYGRTQSRRR